jgi:hypothetical protein
VSKVRITSLSLPWGFGVGWEYRDSDADVVRRVLAILEDRRIFFEDLNAQIFLYVPASASEVRSALTEELTKPLDPELETSLKAIRKSLQILMSDLAKLEKNRSQYIEAEYLQEQALALGRMRGFANPIIATLAYKYGIEVEDEFAAVLEPSDD